MIFPTWKFSMSPASLYSHIRWELIFQTHFMCIIYECVVHIHINHPNDNV